MIALCQIQRQSSEVDYIILLISIDNPEKLESQ